MKPNMSQDLKALHQEKEKAQKQLLTFFNNLSESEIRFLKSELLTNG
ncbi:hypothetical protein V8G61_10330 [Gaetbulibacter sp. M240]